MNSEQNMKRKSDDGIFNLLSLFNCLEINDIKGPAYDSNLWTSVPINRDIPTRLLDPPNDITVLNYDISSWNISDLCIGPEGYLTQIALNDNFESNSEHPQVVMKFKTNKTPHQYLQSLVQEVYTAMEGIYNIRNTVRIRFF